MNTFSQRNFSAGEITPVIFPRVDLVKYQTGAKTVRNFMVMRHGGLINRPGTKYIFEAKYPDKKVICVPYIYSETLTYILEFGDQYIRVHKAGSLVFDSTKTISAISLGSNTTVTATAHGFSNGHRLVLKDIVGTQQLNNREFVVSDVATNTFKLKDKSGNYINSTTYSTYISGGSANKIFEFNPGTPYTESVLFDLKFKQDGNSLIITKQAFPTVEIIRFTDTSWYAGAIFTGIATPNGLPPTAGFSVSGSAGSVVHNYKITSIDSSRQESDPSSVLTGTYAEPTSAAPITVSWTAVSGISEYNIYKEVNGVYGFLGVAGTNSFKDIGSKPDTTDTPPVSLPLASETPAACTHFQQRRLFFNFASSPSKMLGSKINFPYNFAAKSPPEASDAFSFTMVGNVRSEILHAIDIGALIIFTSSGEWVAQGDANGAITPTSGPNWKQYSYYGASKNVDPIVLGGNALYLQSQGSIIRDFGFDYQVDGYRGNDITVFSAHLFEKHSILAWAYQQTPHSVIWVVRDDGVLLGLTYLREHEILGWHRHDFDGVVEHVTCVPEGSENAVYLVIKRTVNGQTTRYIERMANRQTPELIDLVLSDSTVSYDGRNTTAKTMTISGGTNWDDTETLTITASSATFTTADVGKEIHISDSVRFTIVGYTSSTVVTGQVVATVPVSLRSTATTDWALAIKTIHGLWHLEGKSVSVFADEYVIASPNNSEYTTVAVSGGKITLLNAYSVIHVGLPVTADLETLNVDLTQAETMANKKINTSAVTVHVHETRGIWAGSEEPSGDDLLEGLNEIKPRSNEDYNLPNNLLTGPRELTIGGNWQNAGRIFIRQVDPLPAQILAVHPSGLFPLKGL